MLRGAEAADATPRVPAALAPRRLAAVTGSANPGAARRAQPLLLHGRYPHSARTSAAQDRTLCCHRQENCISKGRAAKATAYFPWKAD